MTITRRPPQIEKATRNRQLGNQIALPVDWLTDYPHDLRSCNLITWTFRFEKSKASDCLFPFLLRLLWNLNKFLLHLVRLNYKIIIQLHEAEWNIRNVKNFGNRRWNMKLHCVCVCVFPRYYILRFLILYAGSICELMIWTDLFFANWLTGEIIHITCLFHGRLYSHRSG